MECKVDKVGMGRQGVMNRCQEDKDRMEWRGKELGDMEMERSDEGVMEDGSEGDRWQKGGWGQRTEDGVMEVVGNGIRKT